MPTDPPVKKSPASQTLSRGIQILETLAENRNPLAIDQLARALAVHRSIAYRLVRTLEDHGLVVRDSSGHVTLGARMAALASGVARDLQAASLPELTDVANTLGMTCFLAILDADECITLVSVEPRHTVASVAQRPGARHPVTVGAPGKAILSILPHAQWPVTASDRLRAEVTEAAARGYATSHNEVIPSVQAIAVPLRTPPGEQPAALAVVHVTLPDDPAQIVGRLQRAADDIRDAIGAHDLPTRPAV